jgi:hypothetical protein
MNGAARASVEEVEEQQDAPNREQQGGTAAVSPSPESEATPASGPVTRAVLKAVPKVAAIRFPISGRSWVQYRPLQQQTPHEQTIP